MSIDANRVWQRIRNHAGHEFRQIRGKVFTYRVPSPRTIRLDTTNRMISRTAIEKALERVPLRATTVVRDLSAPSYIYAILMDERIRRSDW